MPRHAESDHLSESQELKLLAKGDEVQSWKAFEHIFNKYQARIFRMALKYMRSKELAEDVVQEIFLNLWLHRTKLDRVETFNAYLFVSARNMMQGAIRKMLTSKNYEAAYAANRETVDRTLDDAIHRDHCNALIMDAMKLLSPQQHEIFRLAKVQGLSLDDVAEEMNISKRTVKNHLTRAMKTMRERLQSLISISAFILFLPGL